MIVNRHSKSICGWGWKLRADALLWLFLLFCICKSDLFTKKMNKKICSFVLPSITSFDGNSSSCDNAELLLMSLPWIDMKYMNFLCYDTVNKRQVFFPPCCSPSYSYIAWSIHDYCQVKNVRWNQPNLHIGIHTYFPKNCSLHFG